MKQLIILGAGGTASYFIPHCLRYLMAQNSEYVTKVTILDGDVVEERNLLRQGFYPNDLGKVKSIAIAERFQPILPPHIQLEAHHQFVNSVQGVLRHVSETADTITLVSCVDNNMARLRLHLAAYAIHDLGKQVEIIDSGNTEWFGQVLISRFVNQGRTFLSGLYKEIQLKGLAGVQSFQIKKQGTRHKVTSIFTPDDNWRNRLTRGEHELGCQDNVVANPQNIGTNMLAGATLLQALHMLNRGRLDNCILKFDAKMNNVQPVATSNVEEGYEVRVQDILEYLKTEEGFSFVFGASLLNGQRIPTQQVAVTTEAEAPVVESQNVTVPSEQTEQVNETVPTRRRATPNVARTPRRSAVVRTVANSALSVLDDLDSMLDNAQGADNLNSIEDLISDFLT